MWNYRRVDVPDYDPTPYTSSAQQHASVSGTADPMSLAGLKVKNEKEKKKQEGEEEEPGYRRRKQA
mgnify:CR=1 FL=1